MITSTLENIINAGSKDELTKVRRQVRFITDLYANFPSAIVAGGAPLNHIHQVGAKDIDIFVPSIEDAREIEEHYKGECRIIFSRDGRMTNGERYNELYNTFVLEGTVRFKRDTFLVNIIVRPSNRLSRYERMIELFTSFPYVASCFGYLPSAGKLALVTPSAYFALALRPARHETIPAEYTEKMIRKLLLLSMTPNRFFLSIFPLTERGATPTHVTAPALGLYRIKKDYSIGKHKYDWDFSSYGMLPLTTRMAIVEYSTDEQQARDLFNEAYTTYRSDRKKSIIGNLSQLPDVYSYLLEQLPSSTRPLSPNGTDTRTPVQELQPSGGTDTEVVIPSRLSNGFEPTVSTSQSTTVRLQSARAASTIVSDSDPWRDFF